MGGASSSGSYVANSSKRRDQLNKVRGALLDRPGLPPKSKAKPPAQAPAAGNSQEARKNAIDKQLERQDQPGNVLKDEKRKKTGAGDDSEARINQAILSVDPETRKDMLEQASMFLAHVRRVKRAQLHKTVGRARKFWGGGF